MGRVASPTFYYTPNINVMNVKTIWCSRNRIRLEARIEVANVAINKETDEIEVPCWGTAKESTFVIASTEGQWKYSKNNFIAFWQSYRVDTNTPVEVLRQSVCPP
jgi:hypothetical protein